MPKWNDEMDDPDVNELVHDISHDCVIHGFWDVTEGPPVTTNIKRPATSVESCKKRKGSDTNTDGVEEESNGSKVNYNTSTHLFLVKCNMPNCIFF